MANTCPEAAHQSPSKPLTLYQPAESKTRTYHGRDGAGRRMAGPEGTSTVRLAQETFVPRAHQGTEDNCPERLFGSTKS